MIDGYDMFVSERLTPDRSMLEIESLATEDVSPDDDKGGVSIPELIEDCVPDLERDAGIGREKTGSAVTTQSMNGLQ
jgi:hypothetical protein